MNRKKKSLPPLDRNRWRKPRIVCIALLVPPILDRSTAAPFVQNLLFAPYPRHAATSTVPSACVSSFAQWKCVVLICRDRTRSGSVLSVPSISEKRTCTLFSFELCTLFSVSGVCFILLRQRILVCLHYHFFHATSRLQGTQPSRRNESEFISHELEGIDQLAPQKRSSIARTTRSSRRQSCTRDITSFSAASRLSVDSSICSYQRNGSLVFSCIGTTSLSSFSSRSSCVAPSSLTWLRISNQTISYPLGAGPHYRTTS